MFELPMIRVDGKEYLERLQKGEFFMRSSLYYQGLDGKDTARSDPFDGAIPATGNSGFPFSQLGISDIRNPRIMMGNTFIKCFFYYNKVDCRKLQEGIYILCLTADVRKTLSDFASSYALIILSPAQFVEQVSKACEKEGLALYCSDAEYRTPEELQQIGADFIMGRSKRHPSFYKRTSFQNQQEFRFCVRVPFKHISTIKMQNGIEYYLMDSKVKEETYTLNIGSLENISCIMPMSEILSYPVIVNMNNKVVSFLKEVSYEEIEGQRD